MGHTLLLGPVAGLRELPTVRTRVFSFPPAGLYKLPTVGTRLLAVPAVGFSGHPAVRPHISSQVPDLVLPFCPFPWAAGEADEPSASRGFVEYEVDG